MDGLAISLFGFSDKIQVILILLINKLQNPFTQEFNNDLFIKMQD